MSASIRKEIRFRVYVTFTGICLFGAIILFKASLISFKEGPKLHIIATELKTRYRYDTIQPERGNIYSEDGVLLCSSVPEFEVGIDFSVINADTFSAKIDTLSLCMSRLFKDKSADEYKEEFIHAYEKECQYYPIPGKLNYVQYEAMRSFPIFCKGKGYGGFIAKRTEKRDPPYKNLAYRTLGIFRDDNSTGLEGEYNDELTGDYGTCESQKSAAGWIPVEGTEVEPQNGKDIVTTLDMNIQDVAEHALLNMLQTKGGMYGTCIVMEVKTGKIRALVNLGKQFKDGPYIENYNYALIPTEPGSTFKLVTLLSLLNDKLIKVDDMVNPEGGRVRFGDRIMEDTHGVNGPIPIWDAYAQSSNCAMAKLATKYYQTNPSKFIKHMVDLHLDDTTGIDLPGEQHPTINKAVNKWGATTLPWMATGYGVSISPMQTCMLYNAIANNGTMVKPYLVSAIKEYGKVVKTIEPRVVVEHVGDSSTVAQLQKCMRAVVTEGTAKGIQSPFYTMAGKTGTAQVTDGKKIRYADGVYQGSFVGYFPADAPKYTICVVIRTEPHSAAYYGVSIAAPVFRQVADKIFSANIGSWAAPLDSFAKNGSGRFTSSMATSTNYKILFNGINKPVNTPADYMDGLMQMHQDSTKHVTIQAAKVYKNIMPDVKGMGLKDAVYMLETCGLKVRIQGKGKVQAQSIEPGIRIIKGQSIILQLS